MNKENINKTNREIVCPDHFGKNKVRKEAFRDQLRKLYLLNGIGNLSIAGAAWVLLLVTDGYSLIQVGIAETVFHIVSITMEIPSGMFADICGRKKSLAVSCIAGILSGLIRAYTHSFLGVCISIGFSALSYNFWTGTDNALAYDALSEEGQEKLYDGYVARQTVIYRITDGAATLGAGLAVMLGNVKSQLIGVGIGVIRLMILATMQENKVVTENAKSLRDRFSENVQESISFLKGNVRAAKLIYRNCLVGAIDVLLLFFMQAKLPMTGIADWVLGPLLFVMSMGGVLGAAMSQKVKGFRFGYLFLGCVSLAFLGFLASFTGQAFIMTLGGFAAAFADDLIQIRADVELNDMIPAPQRATLISVNSLCFSMVMIVMSPLAGWIFSL